MSLHPLPRVPANHEDESTQYADDEYLYGPEVDRSGWADQGTSTGDQGQGYELVPSSQAEENGEEEEHFLQDMQEPSRDGQGYRQHEEEGRHQNEQMGSGPEGYGEQYGYDDATQVAGEMAGTQYHGYQGDRREEHEEEGNFDYNDTQVQQPGSRSSPLRPQPSIRMADLIEEPMTPLSHHHVLSPTETQLETQHRSSSPAGRPHPIASARAKGQFVPPQRSAASGAQNEHVAVQDIGGRRVLTRQAGMKRSSAMRDEDEEEDDVGRAVEAVVEKFDPTAEIVRFDTKKMLVEEWDKIQAEIVPFITSFVEDKMSATEILHVNNIFYQLNEDARKDLEEGVQKIADEEQKQADCRKVIVDFSKQMQAVAAALSQFGGAAPGVPAAGQ